MKVKTHKTCKCGNKFKLYRTTQKFCSMDCERKFGKPKAIKPPKSPDLRLKEMKPFKPIKKVSDKRKIENAKYTVQRIQFLGKEENKICFVDDCNSIADTIEHQKGRKGFADDYARENNISLYLDERFWKPCCLFHNLEFERNPELSKKYQLSKLHNGKRE